MGLIYAGRMELATRYAALALATPPDVATALQVGRLQDDLAVLLAEMTETVTGLRIGAAIQPEIADLVRHPVRLLRGGLASLPRIGPAPDSRPPSTRWADLPARPAPAAGPVQIWTGLVVAAATAGEGLRAQERHFSGAQRWAALGEVAALAEVLAATRSDLLTELGADSPRDTRSRQAAAALAVEAREVVRLAGDPGQPDGRTWNPVRPSRRIVPISSLAALPTAVENVGRLFARGDASITDVLSLARVLAQTDRAVVAALRTAGNAGTDGRDLVDLLASHSDSLAVAVTRARANVASLVPGSPAVLAQGREIGAAGLPKLRAAAVRPSLAREAVSNLTAYAAATAGTTVALLGAASNALAEHSVAVRDHSDDALLRWVPAAGFDLPRLMSSLDEAARTARRAALVATTDQPGLGAERALRASTAQLREALARRQVAMRPEAPTTAALTAEFEPLGRRRANLGA